MTPKGLLRLKDASSSPDDLASGGFRPVLDDATLGDKSAIRRLVLCAGKVYYDLAGHEARDSGVALARLEQLYPFPTEAATALIASYPSLGEVVWAQEEPQNMGPWRSIRHRLEEAAAGVKLRYVGRPWRASPSEGYPTAHGIEQDRIAREALSL
jgi:2-oxoglutarate dehydrogenase E1 component